MERAVSQSVSPSSDDRWDEEDREAVVLVYPPNGDKEWRPLPDKFQAQAYQYINAIVRRSYPANFRQEPAWALWLKFCEFWHETGEFKRAMRRL